MSLRFSSSGSRYTLMNLKMKTRVDKNMCLILFIRFKCYIRFVMDTFKTSCTIKEYPLSSQTIEEQYVLLKS